MHNKESARRAIDRSREAILDVTVEILLTDPAASMADIAERVGVGRTTLYRLFPTRVDVIRAVALDSADQISRLLERASIADAFAAPTAQDASENAFAAVITGLIPMGPRMNFLLKASGLDADSDIVSASAAIDVTISEAIDRGRAAGYFSSSLASGWILESLYATAFIAWEAVHRGDLAPNDAPGLVLSTWLHGTGGSA